MIGEYERITWVEITHTCGCVVNHRINRQPRFSLVVSDLEKMPCLECRKKAEHE